MINKHPGQSPVFPSHMALSILRRSFAEYWWSRTLRGGAVLFPDVEHVGGSAEKTDTWLGVPRLSHHRGDPHVPSPSGPRADAHLLRDTQCCSVAVQDRFEVRHGCTSRLFAKLTVLSPRVRRSRGGGAGGFPLAGLGVRQLFEAGIHDHLAAAHLDQLHLPGFDQFPIFSYCPRQSACGQPGPVTSRGSHVNRVHPNTSE